VFLTSNGMKDATGPELAARLGCTTRTVQRLRARQRGGVTHQHQWAPGYVRSRRSWLGWQWLRIDCQCLSCPASRVARSFKWGQHYWRKVTDRDI
jgi:hypothetical protein